jgi:uncharacterized protein (DUF305 family)
MTMACGNMQCPSSQATMKENMAMHAGMVIKYTCDPGVDLVRGMIPHHDGAVKMCKILRDTAKPMGMGMGKPPYKIDPFLDKLCKDIEKTQKAEITMMTNYLRSKKLSAVASCPKNAPGTVKMMGMVMGCGQTTCPPSKAFMNENMAMHMDMVVKLTCDPGLDFVRGMIPHHIGAVKMCNVVTNSAKPMGMGMGKQPYKPDAFVTKLCKDIVQFQNTEISMMTNYLKSKGKAVKAPCGSSMGGGGMNMGGGGMNMGGKGKTININWIIKNYMPMTAAVGDTVSFKWGGNHNVFLHPSGTCTQGGSKLVGSRSARTGSFKFTKPGKYTFACQVGSHCAQGQIVTFTVGGMKPMPMPMPMCKKGSLCGGQVQVSCGTMCPPTCGQKPRNMCNRMCFRGVQCPRGQWWDGTAGKCVPNMAACSGMGR